MMRVIKILLIPALLLWAGNAMAAQPFSALWIFGDSTVDTGWYITASSGENNYNYYMHHHPSLGVGKPTSSPGAMSVEVLATALGLTAYPANQTSGTNYATGGARNIGKNTMPGEGFPGAVPTVTQIKRYLAHHTASSTALYVISSGDNDVAYALKHPGDKRYLQKIAYALATEIYALTQNSNHAKYIIVVGLPQSYGSTQQKKNFRATYNTKLQKKLQALHVSYLWGDADGVRHWMETYKNDPSGGPFHITNYTLGSTSCSGTCSACPAPPIPDPNGQSPITTGWAYVCSTTAGAPSMPTNAAASEWADDEHYATGGQSVLGVYFYCAARNQWPSRHLINNPTFPVSVTCDQVSLPTAKK